MKKKIILYKWIQMIKIKTRKFQKKKKNF
jgi:hypothetical protein